MGFWTWRTFSWALVGLLLMGSLPLRVFSEGETPSETSPHVADEEAPTPWLLQPLEPPSPLTLANPRVQLDYSRRLRPGWVHLKFTADLSNAERHPVRQSLLFVAADPDASVRFAGKPLIQEKLVMPLPSTLPKQRSEYVTSRVSVVRLIVLEGERGQLVFEGHQKLEFLDESRHRVALIMPLNRAWKQVDDSEIAVRPTDELHILSPGWTKENQLYVRPRGKYGAAPVELEVAAIGDEDPGLGAWWAVPALRHGSLWGLGAVLLALVPGVLARPLWWLAPPLAVLLHSVCLQHDPVCAQWTYFRGARLYEAALQAYQWYVVPTLALSGALVGFWLSREGPKEDR